MKASILIILLFISLKTMGQSTSISYDDCAPESFCIDCGDVKATYSGTENLQAYFSGKVDKKALKGIMGKLFLQVIVGREGYVCCKSISNITNVPDEVIKGLKLDEVIKAMKPWSPAQSKVVAETSSVTIKIELTGTGEFKIEQYRMGAIKLSK